MQPKRQSSDTEATRFSVAQLVGLLRTDLQQRHRHIEVVGEMREFRMVGTRWFFQLRQGEFGVSCIMLEGRWRQLGFKSSEGDRVVASGQLTLYKRSAQVRFEVKSIERLGEGDEHARLLALKQKLRQEGLFDAKRKRPLPRFARVVGVVTARGGAVIHDIVEVARARNPGVRILLSPSRVTGESAGPELKSALLRLQSRPEVDVIILGRGGGSEADLVGFQDEALVRAVAECPIPVVTAIGHESDQTLCDMASDLRASTPSHAAELIVDKRSDIEAHLHAQHARLVTCLERARAEAALYLSETSARLQTAARRQHRELQARARALEARLESGSPRKRLAQRQERLRAFERRLLGARPELVSARATLNNLEDRATRAALSRRERGQGALTLLASQLDALSPLKNLERGFVVVKKGEDAVTRAASLDDGDEVDLRFHDGERRAKILGES